VDVPRLAQALGAVDAAPRRRRSLPAEGAAGTPAVSPWHWPCHGCGRVLDPTTAPDCPQCGAAVQAPRLADLQPLLQQARERLARDQAHAMQHALADLRDPELLRVAATTGRPEHRAAQVRADRRWWLRLGAIAAAFVAALAVAWLSGP
jgi:hypothetical protein